MVCKHFYACTCRSISDDDRPSFKGRIFHFPAAKSGQYTSCDIKYILRAASSIYFVRHQVYTSCGIKYILRAASSIYFVWHQVYTSCGIKYILRVASSIYFVFRACGLVEKKCIICLCVQIIVRNFANDKQNN